MKKIASQYVLIGAIFTILTGCLDQNYKDEHIQTEKENSNTEVLIEKDIESSEIFDNPLMSYYGGSLSEGSIALDVSDFYDIYYQEQGIETVSIQKLIHVNLTNDLKVVDLEGNNVGIDEIDIGDIIYLDFDLPNREDEFKGGEATIETEMLVVDRIMR